MAAPVIGLVFAAFDGTASTIDKINARIEAFSKRTQARVNAVTAPFRRLGASIAKFSDVSGLTRVGGAVRGLARAGVDAYQKVGQLVPLIGIIGSVASVAGITRMVNAWTEWGSRVGFTAQRIGISADKLTSLQGAARLAGSSAEGAANGLQTLGQTMYDAIGGRAPEAIVMFRTLGIAFQDASGHARSVTDVLPEVADKIKAIRDPFAQAQVATALFGGAAQDLLPFLRMGSAGIREYTEMARRYGVFSDASAAAANRMREAQARVSLAVEGLRNRIAERLEPVLAPLLAHFAEWLATSPQVAQGIDWLGQKVQQLAAWIDGGGIQRFGDTMTVWLDRIGSVTHALGGDGGAMGALEALMAVMAGSFVLKVIAPFLSLGTAIGGVIARLTVLTAEAIPALAAAANKLPGFGASGAAGMAGWLGRLGGIGTTLAAGYAAWQGADWLQGKTDTGQDGIANLLHNMMFEWDPRKWTQSYHAGQDHGSERPASRGEKAPGWGSTYDGANATQGSGAERNVRNNNPTNLTFAGQAGAVSDGRFARFKNMETGVAADLNQFLLYQDRDRLMSIAGMVNKATPISENPGVRDYIDRVSKQMGVSPNDRINLHDPDVAKRFILAVSPNEGGTPDAAAVERGVALRLGSQDSASQPTGPKGAPMMPPSAQGAPLALNTGGGGANDNGSKSTVRLEFGGKLPDGMKMRMDNPQNVDVGGPLVERPQLLGAMP